jgi:uncharacterized protein (TIGR03437 family)
MKSSEVERRMGLERLGAGALRLTALIFAFVANASAQSVPASISTIQQPGDHPIFDASGNAYYLSLSGPPTAGAAQTQPGGGTCSFATNLGIPYSGPCPDAAVMKVDPSGNEIWGTLLGGPTADTGTALAVDSNGNVVLTGSTGGQFPTTPGAAIASSTTSTVFAAKISADGSKFLYSTYLPDSAAASSYIAVDAAGNAYIAGKTSAGYPFVLKLSADGSIVYNATLAASSADAVTAIAADSAGNALVAGNTTSPDFPVTPGAFQQQLKGSQNCFLIRLDPSGNVLASTYFGGSGSDNLSSIAVDGAGNIDLAGSTSSLDLPTTPGTMQPSAIVPPWNNTSPAGFVAQFAPDGSSLQWASYVMSSDFQPIGAIFDVGVSVLAVSPAGDIYIGGLTGPGFPVTPSAPVICFPGATNGSFGINGFLAHLNSNGALIDATYLGNSAGDDVNSVEGLGALPGGSVLIAWQSGPGVISNVQFGSGGWMAPACLSNDVLNAATQSGSGGIAPGELVTLTGFGIGPDIGVGYQPDAQGNAPTQLAGVQVFFDGAPVPVLYAQSRQINAIAPVGLAVNGTTQVTATYNKQQFGPAVAQVIFGNPGIFRLQIGQSAQAVAINQDGTMNGPTNPAARGSVVAVWGTGYGQTNPPCPSGGLNLPYAAPLSPDTSALIYHVVFVTPIGEQILPAQVQYAGSAPTLVCGVVQINFQVPTSVAPGTFSFLPSTIQNGYNASIGATIAVK